MRQPILSTAFLANVMATRVCGGVPPTVESFVLHCLGPIDLAPRAACESDIRLDLCDMGMIEVKGKYGYPTFEQRK